MAKDNFPAVMAEIFRHEGGMSTDPRDPGNWTGGKVGRGELLGTKFGIAAHANPGIDIPNLTRAQAAEIYRRRYWLPVRGDDLRPGLDLVTMDPAVNSGVSRGVRWLQAGAGVPQDGKMGPRTLAAANDADPRTVIRKATAARLGFLRGLRTWTTFGRGWSRRVAQVEAVAMRMALEASGAPVRPALAEEEASATASVRNQQTAMGGTAVTGGGLSVADIPDWALALALVLAVLAVISLSGRIRVQQDRAAAMAAVAKEAEA